MATEDKFPTLRDLRDGLTRLIDEGLGDLAAQIIIVPDLRASWGHRFVRVLLLRDADMAHTIGAFGA